MRSSELFCAYGKETRQEVSAFTAEVFADSTFQVIEQTSDIFRKGLTLYESRLDKCSSLTDCVSMNICRELGITEVLTHDHHFEQEGFTILL